MGADRVAEKLDFIRVVLARPRESKNIGAVCRAMKNMGLKRLYVAGGEGLDLEKAEVLAIHASDVLENTVFVPNLREAIDDCSLIAGMTRRWGKHRKYLYLDPRGLAERLLHRLSGEVALVFGNEVSGLSDEELKMCHVAVTIPSSKEFPCLNLSHSVQVIAYEVYSTFLSASGGRFYSPVAGRKLESLVDHIGDSLSSLGFFKLVSPEDMKRFWRDILARAALHVVQELTEYDDPAGPITSELCPLACPVYDRPLVTVLAEHGGLPPTDLVMDTEVQVVRAGDVVLVGLPSEVYVEYGLEIKQRSRYRDTFVLSYCNDYFADIITREAVREGCCPELEWTHLHPDVRHRIMECLEHGVLDRR